MAWLAAIWLVGFSASAISVQADEGLDLPPGPSPVAAVGQDRVSNRQAPSERRTAPALTRAAEKNRAESVSPTDWLRRFGVVEVRERRR